MWVGRGGGGEGARWWKVGAGRWLEDGCRAGVAGGEGAGHGEGDGRQAGTGRRLWASAAARAPGARCRIAPGGD